MAKVALHIVQERREALTGMLRGGGYLPVRELCKRLRISEATARRDLAALALEARVVRTYGGAMGEYNAGFAGFQERQKVAVGAKRRIARKAADLVQTGMTVFIDAGTTLFAFAEELARKHVRELTVVTNSVAVAERLAGVEGMEVHLLGGRFLHRQSVLLGEEACAGLKRFDLDLALLGAEGFDAAGLWNSQADVTALQRAAMERAKHHVFCVDKQKLGRQAPEFLAGWGEVDQMICDARGGELKRHKILLTATTLISV